MYTCRCTITLYSKHLYTSIIQSYTYIHTLQSHTVVLPTHIHHVCVHIPAHVPAVSKHTYHITPIQTQLHHHPCCCYTTKPHTYTHTIIVAAYLHIYILAPIHTYLRNIHAFICVIQLYCSASIYS